MDNPALTIHAKLTSEFQWAVSLARTGRYDEAMGVVSALETACEPSALVLDLKARIAAQRGLYSQAELYWLEAEKLRPGDPSIRRGIEFLQKHRTGTQLVPIMLWCLLLGIVIVSQMTFVAHLRQLNQASSSSTQSSSQPGASR